MSEFGERVEEASRTLGSSGEQKLIRANPERIPGRESFVPVFAYERTALFRGAEVDLGIDFIECWPNGLLFQLRALVKEDLIGGEGAFFPRRSELVTNSVRTTFRFGVAYEEGCWVSSMGDKTVGESKMILTHVGLEGSSRFVLNRIFVSPLPPAAQLCICFEWRSRDVPFTSAVLESGPLLSAVEKGRFVEWGTPRLP